MSDQNVIDAISSYIDGDNEGFLYNPNTGRLYKIQEVEVARIKDGMFKAKSITFHGKQRQSTHLMFYLMKGRFPMPEMVIDHKDRDGFNNKWDNLREATYAQNMYNRASPRRLKEGDEILEKGVSKIAHRYRVVINGYSFGTFTTAAEANKLAQNKRAELHGEFAFHERFRRRV